MYLNEESFHSNQGNIVRFLRSLVLSKNNSHGLGQGKLGKSRVFGRDLKLHLTETRQESKFFSESYLAEHFELLVTQPFLSFFFQFRQYSEFAPSAQSIVALLMAFTDFQGFHQISELSSKFNNSEFILSKEIILNSSPLKTYTLVCFSSCEMVEHFDNFCPILGLSRIFMVNRLISLFLTQL